MNLLLTYTVAGLITGCLYALTASGLVVTYTTSGIFNFAHGAIGMFMAFTYWQLTERWHVPVLVALLLSIFVLAPLLGAFIERAFVRPLYGSSLSVTLVVTLGLLLLLLGIADALWPPTVTRELPKILPGQVHIFGLAVTYYQLMVLVVSVLVAVALRVLFTRTRIGVTMRAVVDDRDLTARSGASPHRTAQLSWALGAGLAALAGILIAPIQHLDQLNLTLLVIDGYAAAMVGRLKSLPLTVAGAMVLGLVYNYSVGYLPNDVLSWWSPVIPMALLFLVVLVTKPARLQTARLAARSRRATMGLLPSVATGAAFVAACWVVSGILDAGNVITFGVGLTLGIVMLSLVLLTGYGGQVSLAQMTFAGFGAFAMGKVAGGDSIVGMVAAFVFPAAVGGVLAAIVLRLRGLYLALATLAFAYAMESLFFNHVLGFGGILEVGRIGAQSQRAFLMQIAVIFAVLAVAILALRRGPFGRRLRAMNDSEAACASLGMSVTATKVIAFMLAAGIAGLGGALYGGWQRNVGTNDFAMLQSLILLLIVTLGGIGTVTGAFAAALFFATRPIIESHLPFSNGTFILVGLGAVSVGQNPDGFAGQLSDAIERVRALARQARPREEVQVARAGH